MSRSTHQLKHEHRVIEQAMRALEGMCLHLRAGERVPDTEMSKLLDFIRHYVDGSHHTKEESLLFPALVRAGVVDEKGALGFLHSEHVTERRLLYVIEHSLGVYRDGTTSEGFVSAALAFRDHLISHMEHEEAVLFRLAEAILDDEGRDALFRCFTEQSREEAETSARYERVAAELEEAWAV